MTNDDIDMSDAVVVDDGAVPVTRSGNYEPVRFNAMKHGILSRLVVLAHEDHAVFDDLLDALIAEHRPAGVTERHLIEELASIIWRKRRVLLAEGARINEGLKAAVTNPKSVMSAAAPFQAGLTGEDADLRELMVESANELTERQRETEVDLAATQKAISILSKGGANAYNKARKALIEDSRDWWDELVAEEEYPATAEGLDRFVRFKLMPVCFRLAKQAQFTEAIKTQTVGESLRAHQLEKLNRYETHLDRKFERTLAMLLKLKDLRGA